MCISGLGPENMKAMLGAMKWVLDHLNVGWNVNQKLSLMIMETSDGG